TGVQTCALPIFRLDLRVLGFAAAAAMAVLILAGLLPSLKTSYGRLSNSLNLAARGSSGSSAALRRTIVIGEVAISVVLICGAALLFKSMAKLQQVDAGVRIDHVITMSTDLPPAVVINQELARNLSSKFGVVNPVGRMVRIALPGYGSIPESLVSVEIVGVIRSERTSELQATQRQVAYVPLAQVPQRDINLVV